MDIISRAQWGARYADGYANAPVPAPHLILHHSATAMLSATGPQLDEINAMRQLERIGQDRFGSGMSYTFAVFPSGRIYQGVSIGRASAHTLNHNYDARAIVMVGNYSSKPPTDAMLDAIAQLAVHGHGQGWWTPSRIEGGHRDFERPGYTECPGDAGEAAIRTINSIIAQGGDDVANSPEQLQAAAYAAIKQYATERRVAGRQTPVEAWETIGSLKSELDSVLTMLRGLSSVEAVERDHVEGIASQIAIVRNDLAAVMSKLGVEPTA